MKARRKPNGRARARTQEEKEKAYDALDAAPGPSMSTEFLDVAAQQQLVEQAGELGLEKSQPAVSKVERRLWDLVLFSEADRDLVPLRIHELAGKVDVMVFAETEFRFATGEPKPSAFDPAWLSLGSHVRYYKIRATGLEACDAKRLKRGGKTQVRDQRLYKRKGLVNSKCRESFGRFALTQAFVELGGAPNDIVMISDADEMPRAAAMDVLRTMVQPGGRTAFHLGAIHHFKYTLRCERGWRAGHPGATWLKGPTSVNGAFLREIGAQSVRTMDGCIEAGYGPAKCIGPIKRAALANSSWHMSSMSGGVEGVVRKMSDNAANALYDKNATLFLYSTVRARAQDCLHGENAKSKGAANYERTRWGPRFAPRYPDVPAALERALGERKLPHFLGWGEEDGGGELRWDVERPAKVHIASVLPHQFRNTVGHCNMTGCYARLRTGIG